jgi:hypothetical protein
MWVFITFISSIWHPWLMTKWHGHPIVITMIKTWLQVIWYKHRQPYPLHLPMYLPIYPSTHPPTYLTTYPTAHPPTYLPTTHLHAHQPTYLPIHLPTYLFTTYLPTHPPTHYHICYGIHSFECSSMYLIFSLISIHS